MTNDEILNLRPTWLEIDLKAIQENAKKVMNHAGAKRLIAVVKANAYGHGVHAVAQALLDIGVTDFAVATVGEGVTLREQFPQENVTITLLGVQDVKQTPIMVAYQLAPAVGTIAWLEEAMTQIKQGQQLPVQLAVDTGMGRMGAHSASSVKSLYDMIQSSEQLVLSGVFTHFATADDNNVAYYKKQVKNFYHWVEAANIPETYWHLANSGSAIWHHNEIDTNTIRVGSVLYGYNPGTPELTMPFKLSPVLSLKSKIGSVHCLETGESVSYGATYTAEKPQWVATLPIGYADGYLRRMSGMKVLVDGHIEHVIGRVTMDQIVITLDKMYPVGTVVTLIGQDGDQQITVEDVANYANSIPHEILTTLGLRLPRQY
ncbi:alanine racemase [Leuconostoc falkenbergense]|jgi:alanine racemase|uniref:Alanine racemase n=1 Tax=Leuconostoc falkenbergense TaxID=2766470 RepID=A0A9X3EA74_9LACO|nr:alanine racemase [Leuconostoc falkenbergense]RDG17715.1 alanine racemase [Leuconostoc pseudomesenteroides]MCT4410043.1 alanine racemase [Leuconostoc falkenbergense]MCX7579767.1 alanine racemase [Leuconostoc falkenbergense]MDV3546513.1 alanine racemase [Leuconostoc falkenbergense]VTU63057.1 alanine racemase [Lactobacillus murinus] [Leuconostoc pseudomesenteroides]